MVEKLGLYEGDKLQITEKDGPIHIMPVVVYLKKYLNDLKEELNMIKRKINTGKQPVFDSVDELFEHLDSQ